jgi:hypothetical protein
MDRAAKRRRLAIVAAATVSVIDSTLAVDTILSAFGTGSCMGLSNVYIRNKGREELHKFDVLQTPYGTIIEPSELVGTKGTLKIKNLNVFAFIYYVCSISNHFATFLQQLHTKRPDGYLTIAFYLDEARPGNLHRPEHARLSHCIYWSILEVPNWFRSRRAGWLPFAYVLCKEMAQAGVDDSMLFRFVIRRFDCNTTGPNVSSGFRVEQNGGGSRFEVRAKIGPLIADWKQHLSIFNLKGYNGSVPCSGCQNCLGHTPMFHDPFFVHLLSDEHHRFIPHTDASFRALADEVKHTAETNPAALPKHEQSTGLKYNPEGLMWDIQVREKMSCPSDQYLDWMHGIVASGGFGQYELNQVVLCLGDEGIPREEIDEWTHAVKKPRGNTKLSKHFFRDRVVDKRKGKIRAFASEVLSAVTLLGMFINVVVKPLMIAALQDVLDCFDLLQTMLWILQTGDPAYIPELKRVIHVHHVLFNLCFPLCRIPKLHAMIHIPTLWILHGVLLSCFAPERHHKLMKKVMAFAYRNATRTALAYDVRQAINLLCDPLTFQPTHLGAGGSKKLGLVVNLPGRGEATLTDFSYELTTPGGTVKRSDLLLLSDGSLGFAVGFVKVVLGRQTFHAAIMHMCDQLSEKTWRKQSVQLGVVSGVDIVKALYYIEEPDHIKPLYPLQ